MTATMSSVSQSVTNFFSGNPLSTPVGQKIGKIFGLDKFLSAFIPDQATDATLSSENWALNMDICDMINESEDGPKDAARALRKRFQQSSGKHNTAVLYTLTVLETCVKNCGKRLHVLVCSKDFVQELLKLIGPKNDPPAIIQEKVLSLIQSWADAFRHDSELQGVVQVYQELKNKGIEFPMTDLDSMAPIQTPPRTSEPPPIPAVNPNPSSIVPLNSEQLAKLKSELDVVRGNMRVFSEMLTELVPGSEHQSDLELLTELYQTCQLMQERLVELVDKVSHDEVTAELLRINDEMNNLFLRYNRYQNNRAPGSVSTTSPISPLIDLGDSGDVTSKVANMRIKEKDEDHEFDQLAQSRGAGNKSNYENNINLDQLNSGLGGAIQSRQKKDVDCTELGKETDFEEMEAWLSQKSEDKEALTSSEFDRFLAERAAAAETLPTVPNAAGNSSKPHRKIDEDDSDLLYKL